MKRKNIGVCVTGYNWEYETRVVDGIYSRCRELGVNLLVFASLLRRPEIDSGKIMPESVVRGETEIFSLINYNMLDGIIILGDSIIREDIIYDIADKAKKHGIPVVNVNDPSHVLEYNVQLSDKTAMEFVVRHLVEEHSCRKIAFIGGFPGNLQTEERLAGYKKILIEHDIPIDEEFIGYGQFWTKSADVAQAFMEMKEPPEAIVCASDSMAIFVMKRLQKLGFKIPEEIIVTGFDGVKECEMYIPSLTTVRRAFGRSGVEAVNLIESVWNGQRQPECIFVNSMLVKNHSCGCKGENDMTREELIGYYSEEQLRVMEFNMELLEMNTQLSDAASSEKLYAVAEKGAEFFHMKKFYICICSDVENGVHSFTANNENVAYNGLSDTMISMMRFGHDVPIGEEFPTGRLVPEGFLDGDEPVFYGFSPLYFKNSFLGYVAYEPELTHGMGDYFPTWLTSISTNAGSFYTKNELEIVLNKLENLYMRDPLTGLFNRRGMQRFGKQLLNEACRCSERLAVVCADIDGLKPINDMYGHEAGDNAILQAANALSCSFGEKAVCTRTGGDEYSVILICTDEEMICRAIAMVDEYLDNYNSMSGLPYKVSCSCGYHIIMPTRGDSMDSLIKAADTEMYKKKQERKKNMR